MGGNLRFLQGPIAVSLSVQKDENLANKSVTWTMISGSYDFGGFKLHAGANKVDNSDGVVGFVNSNLWTVGASFKATPLLTVAAQYWTVKEKVGVSTSSKLLVLNADYAAVQAQLPLRHVRQRRQQGSGACTPVGQSKLLRRRQCHRQPMTRAMASLMGIRHVF
jgi:hypothetical protein